MISRPKVALATMNVEFVFCYYRCFVEPLLEFIKEDGIIDFSTFCDILFYGLSNKEENTGDYSISISYL